MDILLDILLKPPQPLMGLFFFVPDDDPDDSSSGSSQMDVETSDQKAPVEVDDMVDDMVDENNNNTTQHNVSGALLVFTLNVKAKNMS